MIMVVLIGVIAIYLYRPKIRPVAASRSDAQQASHYLPKPTFWRLSEISSEEDIQKLEQNLDSLFDKQENSYKLTFAPSTEGYTAFVRSSVKPPRGNVHCPLDEDFYGITPLYSYGDDARVEYADTFFTFSSSISSRRKWLSLLFGYLANFIVASSIITVPGLGAHPTGSFRSEDGKEVWLCDFLREDVKNCRVLVYGYDSSLAKADDKSSIGDRALSFLNKLCAFREGTMVRRVFYVELFQ